MEKLSGILNYSWIFNKELLKWAFIQENITFISI